MTEFRRFAVQAFMQSVLIATLITAAAGGTYVLRVMVWVPFYCSTLGGMTLGHACVVVSP